MILRFCPDPLPTGHHPSGHLRFRTGKPVPGFPICPGQGEPLGWKTQIRNSTWRRLSGHLWLVLPVATSENTRVGLRSRVSLNVREPVSCVHALVGQIISAE